MTNAENLDDVINRLEEVRKYFLRGELRISVFSVEMRRVVEDAIETLKTYKPATVEPKRIDLSDETRMWLDKMDAVDALSNIAEICIDLDGYRTADGLGGLINEVWSYARYCADKLKQEREPVKPRVARDGWYRCGKCDNSLASGERVNCESFLKHPWPVYCETCGRKVKWK